MDSRKIACFVAAGILGCGLVGAATNAPAAPPVDVTVRGKMVNPELQRTVSYADLNLAYDPAQRILSRRISHTAYDLCWDLNGSYETDKYTSFAIRSTDGQVAAAIVQAKRRMAGLPAGPAVAISMVIAAR